jgi:hypothetical protein
MNLKLDFNQLKLNINNLLDTLKSNITDKKRSILFLDRDFDEKVTTSDIDIILSPSFYWCRIEKLPFASATKAKDIAPAIFDSFLPDGDFQYMAIKKNAISREEAEFLLFAFEPNKILEKFENIGIKKYHKVYFAQTEFEHIDKLMIDNYISLVNQNGIVTQVPSKYLTTTKSIKNYHILLSKHNIDLTVDDGKLIDNRTFYTIFIGLSIFIILYLIDYTNTKKRLDNLITKQDEIYRMYNLPTSAVQIESVLKQLKTDEITQLKLRDGLLFLSTIPFESGEYFTKIDIAKGLFKIDMRLNNQTRVDTIKEVVRKKFKINSSTFNNQILSMDIK